MITNVSSWANILTEGVEQLRAGKRKQERNDKWFLVQELWARLRQEQESRGIDPAAPASRAELLCRVAAEMPLHLPRGTAIAGSQDYAFSPSYALINPEFRVETFAGYCDPTAIYADISPDPDSAITAESIAAVKNYWEQTPYVRALQEVYRGTGEQTREVVYFVEPVTGHTIPDLRTCLRDGVPAIQKRARALHTAYGDAMASALEAVLLLAQRYRTLALTHAAASCDPAERTRLETLAAVLGHIAARGCRTLHEAIQGFVLLWQGMTLEQSPNPYAFSTGCLDRILQPFYDHNTVSHEEAVALVRHLHAFFQVGNRCWAISQNVLVGGRDENGCDRTCPMTYVILDAFFASNDPQPALSVRLHRHTPRELMRALGRFFFTPGHSTPSVFNDDSVIEMLAGHGVAPQDAADYAIAGCQEPLIMGKASLNTTNTWLNLAKVLELACNDGVSLLTGAKLAASWEELGISGGADEAYRNLEDTFYRMLDSVLPRMRDAGNQCTTLLGRHLPVPFTSALMQGIDTGRDMRDPLNPGVQYHGSGCLVHGLSVVANGLHAASRLLETKTGTAQELRAALQADFDGYEHLRDFLRNQQAFGNNEPDVDTLAASIVAAVSERIRALRNPAGTSYCADWSTPSTHLLYGYLCRATPDGRGSREMLGYGIDPRAGTLRHGWAARTQSTWKLPFHAMNGGYASHVGLSVTPSLKKLGHEQQGEWLWDEILSPLFRFSETSHETPYYVYFNVDDASHLRAVLADPGTHAPDGVYIVRIHGTFVNFLDLSPAIQQDIIRRLDLSDAPRRPLTETLLPKKR